VEAGGWLYRAGLESRNRSESAATIWLDGGAINPAVQGGGDANIGGACAGQSGGPYKRNCRPEGRQLDGAGALSSG